MKGNVLATTSTATQVWFIGEKLFGRVPINYLLTVGGRCLPSILKIMGESGILLNELTNGHLQNATGGVISTSEILDNNQ